MENFDYIVIGFGKGGKTLATDLATNGKHVAMVEESAEMYGGTCINIACIPTKLLIHEGKNNRQNEDNTAYYQSAINEKNKVTARLREKNYKSLAAKDTVTIYTAEASFVSERQLRLKSGNETLDVSADHFIINTGSIPIIPPIDGIEEAKHVYTSTELQQVADLPEELIIAGGGYIGLEFAVMYANFGSKVTIIDSSESFMENDDRDIAEEVLDVLKEKEISIIHGSKVTAVSNITNGIQITYKNKTDGQKTQTGSALLLATGRKPNTEKLKLQNAGVETDENGAIIVNDHLKTSQQHIWAIGDVKGGPQFTYISLDDYRIIRDQVLTDGVYSLNKRRNVPYSIFIEPVLSHVGLTEKLAEERKIPYKKAIMPAKNIPYTNINKQKKGLLKALIHPETEEILGCTLFCAESSEMINIVRVAMEAGLPYTFLRDNIFTHPTMSEGLNDLFKKFDD